MKNQILLSAALILCAGTNAQNVGVGTSTPTEKLDVNGNINVTGQVKVNGNAGAANQVLMKDAGNMLTWGDLSEYKNLISFDCSGIAYSAGASNCSDTWEVPTGVTKIFVECWGGGGGGCSLTGGGGGGYISAKLGVTPGTTASVTIAAGGNYGNSVSNGIIGGNTSFVLGGVTLEADGGAGGMQGDPTGSLSSGQAVGGSFSISGLTSQSIGYYGSPGGISKLTFMQAGSADFAKIVNYGNGGDAALFPGSGSKGGYRILSASVNQIIYATQYGIQPGGGGGADASFGFYGKGGRIIIHW